jgi:hypothetical protein
MYCQLLVIFFILWYFKKWTRWCDCTNVWSWDRYATECAQIWGYVLGSVFSWQELPWALHQLPCTWHYTMPSSINEFQITPEFKQEETLYIRYIDEVIVAWTPYPDQTPDHNCLHYIKFQHMINSFGKPCLEFSKPTKKINFLDITITHYTKKREYRNSIIRTRTKPLPLSAPAL